MGTKPMPFLGQLACQRLKIINFTIVNDDDGAILVEQGLRAIRQIDN